MGSSLSNSRISTQILRAGISTIVTLTLILLLLLLISADNPTAFDSVAVYGSAGYACMCLLVCLAVGITSFRLLRTMNSHMTTMGNSKTGLEEKMASSMTQVRNKVLRVGVMLSICLSAEVMKSNAYSPTSGRSILRC